jgi:endonuclease/exonuclease/phosphatase family metal-dependent hydrolase
LHPAREREMLAIAHTVRIEGQCRMTQIRICSLNAEWMNDWFTSDSEVAAFKPTFTRDEVENDTAETAGRLAAMINAIDPDVLAIQEGPSRNAELGLFVHDYLSGAYEHFLGDTGAAQKLGLLYKPDAVDSASLAPHADIEDLIDPWDADVDGNAQIDEYSFTRTPLVVDITIDGSPVRVIVAHTKSNFINHGRELWENEPTRQSFVVSALLNRRRISTEGMRIRTYLDEVLTADPDAAIVVLGDLNDGPGLDYFEQKFLSHNVTDIIIGSAFAPEHAFTHAQHDVSADERYTAVFEDFVPTPEEKRLLLDHIMLSPGLTQPGAGVHKVNGSGAVRHREYDDQVVNNGARRQDRPTDHRAVSVELATA